jgi:outer membrane protein TolC
MEERYEEGLATTLELTESQNTLTRITLHHLAARQDAAIALKSLELAAGTLASLEVEG